LAVAIVTSPSPWVKLKLPGHDPSMERGRLHKQRRLRNAVLTYPMEFDGRQGNSPAGRSFLQPTGL